MRILVLGGLLLALGAHAAGAADYPYGYRAPEPPPPVYGERGVPPALDEDEDDDDDRLRWRESRRQHHYHRPHRPDPDDGDCWIRRTPYGPERVCR